MLFEIVRNEKMHCIGLGHVHEGVCLAKKEKKKRKKNKKIAAYD